MSIEIEQQGQMALCTPPLISQPGRPTHWSKEIQSVIAEALAPSVLQWVEGNGGEPDLPSITGDLEFALARSFGLDGFEIASELKSSKKWRPDAELVEILDDARWKQMEAHDRAVTEWVNLYSIKPGFSVGDTVSFESNHDAKGRRIENTWFTGIIYKIEETKAQYVIRCAALGHVPEGQSGPNGVVLAYEKVKAV